MAMKPPETAQSSRRRALVIEDSRDAASSLVEASREFIDTKRMESIDRRRVTMVRHFP
jgi:hypothetical protein